MKKLGRGKKSRSEIKKGRARFHTRTNKIKAIKKALLKAGGQEVEKLKERLRFWENQ
jgi:hypothetical protein